MDIKIQRIEGRISPPTGGGGLSDLVENIHQRIVDDFDDLYIGDYFDLPITTEYAEEVVRLRICDYNYLKHAMDKDIQPITCNHITLMSEGVLQTQHKMNAAATTNGGFAGSEFATKVLYKYGNAFNNALNGHLVEYISNLSSSLTTFESTAISKILLPSQEQMTGVSTISYSAMDTILFNRQFELCRRDRDFVVCGKRYWLLNINDSQKFGSIGITGGTRVTIANNDTTYVRPVMHMC